jgi:hypothetical protein
MAGPSDRCKRAIVAIFRLLACPSEGAILSLDQAVVELLQRDADNC